MPRMSAVSLFYVKWPDPDDAVTIGKVRAVVDRCREAAKRVGDTKVLLLDNKADGEDLLAVATALGRVANATEPIAESISDAVVSINDIWKSIPAAYISSQSVRDNLVTLVNTV